VSARGHSVEAFRLDGAINECTLRFRLRERQDRADPRDDYRAWVMLVRLRALWARLLRLIRRPRPFLVRCLEGLVEKVTAAPDAPPGESWAFHHHRTMAEVIAEKSVTP
jgi:hypothetical protein